MTQPVPVVFLLDLDNTLQNPLRGQLGEAGRTPAKLGTGSDLANRMLELGVLAWQSSPQSMVG